MKTIAKQLLCLLLCILIINISLGQQENVIDINTQFTIELSTTDSIMYKFNIIKEDPLNKMEISKVRSSLLNDSILSNQIKGFLYEDSKNKRVYLIIKNGVPQNLTYSLEIKPYSKKIFFPTSTVKLYTNVLVTEMWQNPIEKIRFSNFRFEQQKNQYVIEHDSSCIKNKDHNIERGNLLLVKHIQLLKDEFLNPKGVQSQKVISFEDSILSQRIIPSHNWGLSKSTYPNENKYILDERPIIYKRVECPYFENNIQYYKEKKRDNIRVVSFEWKKHKENIVSSGVPTNEIKPVFAKKAKDIEAIITSVFGEPSKKIIEEKSENYFMYNIYWDKEGITVSMYYYVDNENIDKIRFYIYKD